MVTRSAAFSRRLNQPCLPLAIKRYGIAVMDRAYNNINFSFHDWVGYQHHRKFPVYSKFIRWHPARCRNERHDNRRQCRSLAEFDPTERECRIVHLRSTENTVLNNNVQYNGVVGIYAVGVCTGT